MRTLFVVKLFQRFVGQQPSGFSVAVFFVPLVCLTLSSCAPKERIVWADDKDLILQSLDSVSQSQRLSQSNMNLLNQRMLKLERVLAQQESSVESLTATLKQQKMKQMQWQMVQEQEKNKKKQRDLAAKKKEKANKLVKNVVAPVVKPPSISLAKKLKRIEKDIQQVSAVATRDTVLRKKSKEKDLYTAAYLSLKSGRYDEAILSFQGLLHQFPKGELVDQAYYWLGESFLSKGELDHAVGSFSKLVQAYPKSAKYQPALLKLGMAYREKGRLGDAKAVLQRLIDEYPESRSSDHARTQLASINAPAQ
ncbi:MAG: tol-pal system protein YbgF [Mariprofundaceae bacterium]|nr:tol-pal system protein YbgF [Mariprofundaceae bacterium]